MSKYASNTSVPPERSRAEIERILERYGATSFMYGWEGRRAIVGFRAHDRMVRFEVPMPDAEDADIQYTPTRQRRSPSAIQTAADKERRRRWRALALAIKAKLEVVDSEIATFEEEFLAHIVLPDGTTVGGWVSPQLHDAYEAGAMPGRLLPEWSGDAIEGELLEDS